MKGGQAVASQRMQEALSLSAAAEEHLRQCQDCDPGVCHDGNVAVLLALVARRIALAHAEDSV